MTTSTSSVPAGDHPRTHRRARPAGWFSTRIVAGFAGLVLLPVAALAQLPVPTYGWNLGNTMEAPEGEGAWAPAATRQMIDAVAAAGFNTIRIPVAWDHYANPRTLEIDPVWMARVKQVVDWCYAANLTVIVNNHWDRGWFDSSGFRRVNPKIDKKMRSYWTQIATTFKDYDSRLIFAGANEPDVDSQAKTKVLLQYYQTFVTAVRATGGQNTTRWLAISGPSTNVDKTCDWFNTLPKDPTLGRLIVEVHYYDPFTFALMTADAKWGQMSYFWGQAYHSIAMPTRNPKSGEEAYLTEQIQKLKTKFVDHGIPVLMGEFGAIRRTGYRDLTGIELERHLASRTHFHKLVVDLCNQNGIRPVYWDEGWNGKDGFSLFDRVTAQLLDADSARSLTGGAALPPPADR